MMLICHTKVINNLKNTKHQILGENTITGKSTCRGCHKNTILKEEIFRDRYTFMVLTKL